MNKFHIFFTFIKDLSSDSHSFLLFVYMFGDNNSLSAFGKFGKDNFKRLVGYHETSIYNKFTSGVGDRTVSIRIPHETYKNKKGYFEDRRPSANMNPYLVTYEIFCNSI